MSGGGGEGVPLTRDEDADQPSEDAGSGKAQGAKYALSVLFAINALNFYDRQVLGAVGEEVRREWTLSDSSLGLLNTAFTLLYAVVGLPLGHWADRGRRTYLLAGGVVAWSVLTVLCGASRSFAQLFLLRLGVGVGEATCAPAATSLIGDLYASHRRARAMSIFMLGLPVGLAASFFVSGLIVSRFGWREAFLVAGAPGLVCAVAVVLIREPGRVVSSDLGQDSLRGVAGIRFVLSIPTLWPIVLSGALFNFCIYAIGGFLVAYLRRYHELDPWRSNLASTVAFGLSGIPGLLVGGWLADRAARHRHEGRLWLGALSMLLAAPPWLWALRQPAGSMFAVTAWISVGCGLMYLYYSTVYPTIQEVVEPGRRGIAMAVYFCAMYLVGASFGPWLLGRLSDHFTVRAALAGGVVNVSAQALEPFRAEGLHRAMGIIPALLAAVALVLWAASLTVARDARRATASAEAATSFRSP
jgi:MFS family permease